MRAVPLALLVATVAVAWIPVASAQAGSGTTCRGGETDYRVLWIDLPPILTQSSSLDAPKAYVALEDGSAWIEANGREGLQRTARVCYDQTWDENGTITSSRRYVEYAADLAVTP